MNSGTFFSYLRWPAAIAAVFILLVGWIVVYRSQTPPEPTWENEPFSHWLRDSSSSDPNIAAHARRGFADMAPEASLFLLHNISRKDSMFLEVLNRMLSDLPGSLEIPNDQSDYRNEGGQGFRAMGPLAKSAIPGLEKLLFDEDLTYHAANALACVGGKDSVPIFCAALTNGSEAICLASLWAMFDLGTNSAAALPTLLPLGNSTNPNIQCLTLHLLGRAGKDQPERVIPVLHNALKTLPLQNQLQATLRGLGELGAGARFAVPDVFAVITNTPGTNYYDRKLRSTGAKVLVQILEEDAVPHLLLLLSQQDVWMNVTAIEELGALGTKAAPAVPLLLTFTTNQPDYVVALAIHALGKIRSQPELVVPALIPGLTHTNELISASAALVLGSFGTNAHSAVPTLIGLAETNSLSISHYALEERFGLFNGEARKPFRFALEQIDPAASAALENQLNGSY